MVRPLRIQCVGAIIGRPFLISSIVPPPQSTSLTAPLKGSLFLPLLEERWHEVSEWWLLRDVVGRRHLGRPMIAPTNVRIWDVVGAVPYEVRYLLINYFPDIINLN